MSDNLHLPHNHLLHGKTVAIVGGGPAGLMLARMLQKNAVRARVFERAHSFDSKNQGGSLDLHKGSGQLALRRAGLFSRFVTLSRSDAQTTKILSYDGRVRAVLDADSTTGARPEIDRGVLRKILLDALGGTTVETGKSLLGVASTESGRYQLQFDNGGSVVADVVIGCDGVRSKVRPILTTQVPEYTGVTFIETRLPAAEKTHPDIAALVGEGNILSLGDQKGLLAQRNGDGSIRLYVARRIDERWARDGTIDFSNVTALREQLLSWFPDWSPVLVDMLRRSEDRFHPWPLYALRPQHDWKSVPGVAVIGDAAHVMPPFLGLGANMAMLDAVELADHLLDRKFASVESAISSFTEAMFDRMRPLIDEALATQDLMFSDDAPSQLLNQVID
ncbi:FAD-dependent oxidoreductase [Paraburkholderia caledonica]|uniref:FAD-dependent oxidoreductase n=1 Tax=Paraburkholderia caledonica TaxID=134536 RepID=UPI000372B088|nr:NAD(P)/FAD-dependent oxidoreductase [Paraburkholderia caledonica]